MANENLYCNPITDNLFRRVCKLTKGGIHGVIYTCNFGQIEDYTITAGVLTAVTMKTNTATGNPFTWYQIVHKKKTAGINNTYQKGTNANYFDQTIDFQVVGLNDENKLAFEAMANGEAVFVGKDGNGKWHVVGIASGAELQGGATIGTGIELDSLVGSTAQFLAEETFVMPSVVSGLQITVLDTDGVNTSTVTFP